LNLTAGTNYRLKFFYKALDGVNYPEKLEEIWNSANAADMTTGTLFTNNNISSVYGNAYDSVRVDFTPPSTGVFISVSILPRILMNLVCYSMM